MFAFSGRRNKRDIDKSRRDKKMIYENKQLSYHVAYMEKLMSYLDYLFPPYNVRIILLIKIIL